MTRTLFFPPLQTHAAHLSGNVLELAGVTIPLPGDLAQRLQASAARTNPLLPTLDPTSPTGWAHLITRLRADCTLIYAHQGSWHTPVYYTVRASGDHYLHGAQDGLLGRCSERDLRAYLTRHAASIQATGMLLG